MTEFQYTITDREGIHARPAGQLVKEAGKIPVRRHHSQGRKKRRRQTDFCRHGAGSEMRRRNPRMCGRCGRSSRGGDAGNLFERKPIEPFCTAGRFYMRIAAPYMRGVAIHKHGKERLVCRHTGKSVFGGFPLAGCLSFKKGKMPSNVCV